MICPWSPWSAGDRPYIYRGPRWKCAKNFVLVKIFRFCKNSEKAPKTNEKCSFKILLCLRKNVFFIEQRPQKCIQKCEIFPNFIWSAETWPVHLRRTWPLTFPYLKIAFSLFGGLRTGNVFILPSLVVGRYRYLSCRVSCRVTRDDALLNFARWKHEPCFSCCEVVLSDVQHKLHG